MKFLEFAKKLACDAAQIQMKHFGASHKVEFKGVADIVTEVDKKCERLIVSRIKKHFPDHDIVAEEGGGHLTGSPYRWIIDPLDGTVNYTHGYPLFAVSIALEYKGEVIVGVVCEPNRKELFWAQKGKGSRCNGKKIGVSKTTKLSNALLDTGFAYNVHEGEKENNLVHFADFLLKSRAIRRDGAASVDLCYVACGRYDGFWELYLAPWDIAAGQLIISEAGGKVSTFNGSKLDIYGKEILVSNGRIHGEMIGVLNAKKKRA